MSFKNTIQSIILKFIKAGLTLEKVASKLHTIGKIIAFVAIALSLLQKINAMFGIWDFSKKKEKDAEEKNED